MASADTQIVAQGSMSSIGCGHYLAGTVALYFARGIASGTVHVIALMSDIPAFEANSHWFGNDCSVRGSLVAVEY